MQKRGDFDSNEKLSPFFDGDLVDHCLADRVIEFPAIHCRIVRDGSERLIENIANL